jgi:hypothetical protein
MPVTRFQSRQSADAPAASCRRHIHPPAGRHYQIPIAPAAPPLPNFPRLRALALFGRRPPQGVEGSSCRRPKTCTASDIGNERDRQSRPPYCGMISNRTAAAKMAEQLRKSAMFAPLQAIRRASRIEAPKTVTGCTQLLRGSNVAPHCPAPSRQGSNRENGLHISAQAITSKQSPNDTLPAVVNKLEHRHIQIRAFEYGSSTPLRCRPMSVSGQCVGLTAGQPLPAYPEQPTSSDRPDWSLSCQ